MRKIAKRWVRLAAVAACTVGAILPAPAQITPAAPSVAQVQSPQSQTPQVQPPQASPGQVQTPSAPTEPAAMPGAPPASAVEMRPAASGAAIPVMAAAALPRDLSLWGMFSAADWVVKAVMVGLALASVITWTVWLAKTIELGFAKRRARDAIETLAAARSLGDASERLGPDSGPAHDFLRAAKSELALSAEALDKDGVKERTASRLERLEAACGRRILKGTGILATIGATAPFVGLFGTVWGIMNAFIGISKSHTTNLAVVAPGIAEALLATAFGLVAAIPAVVIYNMFARSIAGYRAQLGDTSADVMRLLSRDLDRRAAGTLDRRSLMVNAAE